MRRPLALTPLKVVAAYPPPPAGGYGFCLRRDGAAVHAFSALKEGTVEEYRLTFSGRPRAADEFAHPPHPGQVEGCVADPRDGALYVGEETAGIWHFGAEATEGEIVAAVDDRYLVAHAEGLAPMPEGDNGGWRVATSQGDNAFAVFALPEMRPVGRSRVTTGQFGAVEETDGVELIGGYFGPGYPEGLFVAQGARNGPSARNFNFASWASFSRL